MRRWVPTVVVLVVLAAGTVVLLRNAWVCDDAYITFRTSANLVEGYGLTWNAGERVQAYTNPLWMFAMAGAFLVTREFYWTCLAAGFLVTWAIWALLYRRIAIGGPLALLGVAALLSSKAIVDYSTSGMENAAANAILCGFAIVWFDEGAARPQRRAFWLGLVAAAGILNRLDAVLLYAPALALEAWRHRRSPRVLGAIALGLAPVALWELFSIVYYGFPFPNTYYAKLSYGVERSVVVRMGFAYLWDSLERDPVTVPVILAGCGLAVWSRRSAAVALAVGALLHLGYVVWIGGDSMSGRFLTAPFMVAIVLLVREPRLVRPRAALSAAAAVVLVGLVGPYSSIRAGTRYSESVVSEVPFADERHGYYPATSPLIGGFSRRRPDHERVRDALSDRAAGRRVAARGAVGYYGYFVGPGTYVIDWLGLGDAFMARLPPRHWTGWRPGHLRRELPAGYRETIESGDLHFDDAQLGELYDKVRLVTRGPLFSGARWQAIWELNTGKLDHLIDETFYRYPRHDVLDRASAAEREVVFDASDEMVTVPFDPPSHARAVELVVDGDDTYLLILLRGRREQSRIEIPASRRLAGPVDHRFEVPEEVRREGFDEIRIAFVSGRPRYLIGRVRVEE